MSRTAKREKAESEAFERLSPEIRSLISSTGFSAMEASVLQTCYGPEKALEIIQKAWNDYCASPCRGKYG
jgi:hypothetical protein